jgi:hypothetical protein
MDTLTSYVDELQGCQALVHVMKSAVFTVLLWRGHFPITLHVSTLCPRPVNLEQPSQSLLQRLFKPVTLKLPLHSIVAFLVGILLAEDYNLFPSFLLFGIAWVLLGTMEYQNSHPSPWRKKRTYLEHLQVLVFNRQFTDTIVPRFNENRYYDYPLYPSHASPHVDSSDPKISANFKGQHLELNMIPERGRIPPWQFLLLRIIVGQHNLWSGSTITIVPTAPAAWWVFLPVLLAFPNSKLVRESPILNRVRKTTLTVLNSGILV